MTTRERTSKSSSPFLWPLGLVIVGALLLLSNFLLLGDFNIIDLWPLLLVVLGAQILLRGDLLPDASGRTFGITRGSVESATIEANAGEIDVIIHPLAGKNNERLIAGQFANQSRPELHVDDTHTTLLLQRHRTPWLSFADWELSLSPDLPWQLLVSTSMGQVMLDLSDVIVQNALISTGLGDINITPPPEAFETLYLRSLLGTIIVSTPDGYNTRITVQLGRFSNIHVDETRYVRAEDGTYRTRNADEENSLVDVVIDNTFGDIYLN